MNKVTNKSIKIFQRFTSHDKKHQSIIVVPSGLKSIYPKIFAQNNIT